MTYSFQDLVQIIVGFGTMGGVAALISILVDILKRFGLVLDGAAPRWSGALNLIALIALVAARYFAPELSVQFLDESASAVAQVAAVVLSLVMQLQLSPAVHDAAVENKSILAFSHSR